MSHIVWSRPDGGVSITSLSAEALKMMAWARANQTSSDVVVLQRVSWIKYNVGLDEHEHEAVLKRKAPQTASFVCIGHDLLVPQDKTFSGAWVISGGVIVHDMTKCRAIHKDRIRALRKPKFEYWDAEWMKFTAKNDPALAANAEAKRQELRDAPTYPAIEAATTPEELKAAIPPCLA